MKLSKSEMFARLMSKEKPTGKPMAKKKFPPFTPKGKTAKERFVNSRNTPKK